MLQLKTGGKTERFLMTLPNHWIKNTEARPSWFGPVDRALACGLKDPGFNSSQGHIPYFSVYKTLLTFPTQN